MLTRKELILVLVAAAVAFVGILFDPLMTFDLALVLSFAAAVFMFGIYPLVRR
jgi:hypothetical protein